MFLAIIYLANQYCDGMTIPCCFCVPELSRRDSLYFSSMPSDLLNYCLIGGNKNSFGISKHTFCIGEKRESSLLFIF